MEKKLKEEIETLLSQQSTVSPELVEKVVSTTLESVTQKDVSQLQSLLAQREKIEYEIKLATQKLQEVRQNSFDEIEALLAKHFPGESQSYIKILTQLKLQSIDILDILKEIAESAFITALENDDEIELAFKEISRELTHKTLKDGYLTLDRARQVVSTIMLTASDIAEATPNMADEILKGALYGTKKGLTQSIRRFKERFDFIPEETAPLQMKNMRQTYHDLQHTDVIFLEVVNAQAERASSTINKKLTKLVEQMKPDLSELISVSKETLQVVGEHIAKFSKTAKDRSEQVLNSKTAQEAKRIGSTVWELTKGALEGAIHTAKDAIEKKQSKK